MPGSAAISTETTEAEGESIDDSKDEWLRDDPENIHGTDGKQLHREVYSTSASHICNQTANAVEEPCDRKSD